MYLYLQITNHVKGVSEIGVDDSDRANDLSEDCDVDLNSFNVTRDHTITIQHGYAIVRLEIETEIKLVTLVDTFSIMVTVLPGGMYWQDPEAFTSTFVWKVASNLSSALRGEKSGWCKNSTGAFKEETPRNKGTDLWKRTKARKLNKRSTGYEVGLEHKGKIRCKEKSRKKDEKVRMKVTER